MVTEDSEKTMDSVRTMDSVVDRKYSGLTPRLMDSPLYPNRMAIERGMLGLDPTWRDKSFDPKRTMDFALFGKVCYGFVLPSVTHESVERIVKLRENDDVPELPPLKVILYNGMRNLYLWFKIEPWYRSMLGISDLSTTYACDAVIFCYIFIMLYIYILLDVTIM